MLLELVYVSMIAWNLCIYAYVLGTLMHNGYRFSVPGVKRPIAAFTAHPHVVPMLKKEYSYICTPLFVLHGLFCGDLYVVCRQISWPYALLCIGLYVCIVWMYARIYVHAYMSCMCVEYTYEFTFMWPCIVTNFLVIKPTRCTNFTNLFFHETLNVSNSSSVHHQEFIDFHSSRSICSCSKAVYKPVWHMQLLSVSQ
jgi:hypothetical protein